MTVEHFIHEECQTFSEWQTMKPWNDRVWVMTVGHDKRKTMESDRQWVMTVGNGKWHLLGMIYFEELQTVSMTEYGEWHIWVWHTMME